MPNDTIGAPVLLKDIQGVLDALAFEVNAKGRAVRFVSGKTTDATIIARSQRQAWLSYRDGPLRDRFQTGNGKRWGFSRRSMAYMGNDAFRADPRTGKPGKNVPGSQGRIRKGSLPDYVFTGKFRDQLAKRTPKRRDTPQEVRSRFSIFGGVMNLLGSVHGRIGEVTQEQRGMFRRSAHQRRGRGGRIVNVRAYTQRGVKRTIVYTKAPKSYAEEWAFQAKEIAGVQKEADANILEGFRTAIYRNGQLKPSIRKRMRAQVG